jgi:hypothetical protein
MPGKAPGGIILTIVLGIIGAPVGGFIGTRLGSGDISKFNLQSMLLSAKGSWCCSLRQLHRLPGNFYQTNLDGAHAGTTLETLTPGVRSNLGTIPGVNFGIDNWLMFGVDIPVSGLRPGDATFRFTYIKNF